MEPNSTPLLRLLTYIDLIILGVLLIIWLVRERIQRRQSNQDELSLSPEKILLLKKKRGIYRTLAVFAWIIFIISLLLVFGLSPKFGDVIIFSFVSYFLITKRQGNKMVLWLRKFNVKHEEPLWFSKMLTIASRGYGLPITVQDSTLKTSSVMAAGQAVKRQPFLILWFVVMAIAISYLRDYSTVILIVGFTVWACLLYYWYLSGKLGYLSLEERNAENLVSNLLGKINERRTSFLSGMIILRCKDVFWKNIVELCLKNAAIVIIDITELTDNIAWELQTALKIMPPENIIFSCAVEGGEKMIPLRIQRELQTILNKVTLETFRIFFYPSDRVKVGEWGGQRKLTLALSNYIAKGLSHPRDINGPVLNCPNCGEAYHLGDYRIEAETWICSYCNSALPKFSD